MAHSVKCLLHKHETLKPIPHIHVEKSGTNVILELWTQRLKGHPPRAARPARDPASKTRENI